MDGLGVLDVIFLVSMACVLAGALKLVFGVNGTQENFYLGGKASGSGILVALLNRLRGRAPEQVTQAPTTFKGADLVLTREGVRFRPFSHGTPYAAEDDSACRGDVKPVRHMRGCTCGFYGYRDLAAARVHPQLTPSSVLLEVVASGEVLEYERGYRFSHQRVIALEVGRCVALGCARPARAFARSFDDLLPVCGGHVGRDFVASSKMVLPDDGYFTFEEVSADLSAQVPKRRPVQVVSADEVVPLTRAELTEVLDPLEHVRQAAADGAGAAARAAASVLAKRLWRSVRNR
jgi:hypothetical protein